MSGKDESGQILSNAAKTQCAIVLLHSLPCARHAVLEQLCDVFHEAVQKYVVEFERQALSGEISVFLLYWSSGDPMGCQVEPQTHIGKQRKPMI